MTEHLKSRQLLEENSQFIPGGLASLNRKAEPCIAFCRGDGARIWDIEGNEYIDYHAAFAPHLLGHNDPDVTHAIKESLDNRQSLYGSGPTAEEGELGRLFLDCVPSAEKVQFLNTGSEATAQAIRVARAATGKPHVLLIQGSYNGHHNIVAANLMSSKEELGGRRIQGDEYPLVPITAGIPEAERALMHPVEFNDLEAVEQVARRYEIGALITEPVLQNIGVVEPDEGYLEGLRQLADRYGFLLIFDEVKTGFRVGPGGYQGFAGLVPDLSTFGKAMANGYPMAALAGKARYMDLAISSRSDQRVLLAGTYNSHPATVAAAIACLRKLQDPAAAVYDHLETLAQKLERGQRALFDNWKVPAVIQRVASAHCVYFSQVPVRCWWDILESHDFEMDAMYRRALIDGGIYHFPVPCKQGSISYAHSDADIEQTLKVTESALKHLRKS